MPDLADFIRADKTNIKVGAWHTGKINPSAFPMSGARAKAYKYGPSYSWQLVTFDCLGYSCRVLILLNLEKNYMKASFGVDRGSDTALLCDHEFHGDHPGWHCHLETSDLGDVVAGTNRTNKRRWPQKRSHHSRTTFGVTQANALRHACERYRIAEKGGLL